jgi:hypothetical protein
MNDSLKSSGITLKIYLSKEWNQVLPSGASHDTTVSFVKRFVQNALADIEASKHLSLIVNQGSFGAYMPRGFFTPIYPLTEPWLLWTCVVVEFTTDVSVSAYLIEKLTSELTCRMPSNTHLELVPHANATEQV